MNIKTKIKFIDSFVSIFSLKLGKIIKNKEDGKCYRVPRIVSTIFSIYHYGGIGALLAFFIFLLLPNIFNSIVITILVALILYIIMEIFLILLLPFKEVPCWEKKLQEKNSNHY